MNIQVSVGNEDELVAEYRAFLRKQARSIVAGRPERVGKQFARVTFLNLVIERLVLKVTEDEAIKVDFV